MDKEQYRAAKAHLVACMQEGQSWWMAAANAGLQISQSNAYRLWLAARQRGEMALQDGRHGHPIKLRGEARTFLETSCREAPSTPSSSIQAALRDRFDLSVSISQINRVRAALGVSNHPKSPVQGKKRK
jgi:transposase